MQIYQLTDAERETIEHTTGPRNVILVVCDYGGDIGCCVDYAALISEEFVLYHDAIAPLDTSRIKEYTPTQPE
jgi:hypothetical protein